MSEHGKEKEMFSELTNEIREIKEYLQILSLPIVEKGLSRFFTSHKQLKTYLLLDGNLSAPKISDQIGVHKNTINTWLNKWLDTFAIVEKVGNQGKFKKKYSLYQLITLENDGWLFVEDSGKENE